MIKEFNLYKCLDDWFEQHRHSKIKSNTSNNYCYIINKIKSYQRDLPIIEFTYEQLQNILNKMANDNYAKSTIKKVKIVINMLFKQLQKGNEKLCNPTLLIDLPSASEKIVEALTKAQQKRIEDYCVALPLGHIFIFYLYTGLRRNELINLKWVDYDTDENVIYIRDSKTKSGIRNVPLLKISRDIILSQPQINDYIFNNTKRNPVSETVIKKNYKKIREFTDIPFFTTHVCRHTFATRLMEKGAEPKAVAALLGHKDIQCVIKIYEHV